MPPKKNRKEWGRALDEACKKAVLLGIANADEKGSIACFCVLMAQAHPGISPVLLFRGAILSGTAYADLRKMKPVDLGFLQFYEPKEDG